MVASLLAFAVPIDRGLHALLDQSLNHVRAHDLLSEHLLLEELEVSQGRARVGQVLEVGRLAPVLEIGEVCDKGGLVEELLGGEVVEVVRVG